MSKVFYPSCRAVLNVKLGRGDGTPTRDLPNNVFWTTPKSATVHRNRPEQADSFEITFDERDCPFNPALVMSGEVSIYLYNEPAFLEKDRLFDRSQVFQGDKTDGNRQHQLELRAERFTFESQPTIVGLFDEVSQSLGSDGRWMTIQGQDYTSFLLSKQWPPVEDNKPRRIPTGKRLDLTIKDMLEEIDPSGTLYLELRNVKASDLPIVQASGVSGGKRGIPVDSETKYFDVMFKTAKRSGFKLYVDGFAVVLEAPESDVKKRASKSIHLAWGENIEQIRVTKKLGVEKLPAIVLTGYDPIKRKRIEVVYPEGFEKKTYSKIKSERKPKPKDKTTVKNTSASYSHSPSMANEGEYIVIATDITDSEALRRAARSRYEDIGRAERAISLSTRDLVDLTGQSMLDVKSGDAVTLIFDDYNKELLASERMTSAEKLNAMIERGFSYDAANAIVANYSRLDSYKRPLFIRELSLSYDSDSGISVEMELVDFVVLTDSVGGEQKKPDGTRLGAPTKKHETAALR